MDSKPSTEPKSSKSPAASAASAAPKVNVLQPRRKTLAQKAASSDKAREKARATPTARTLSEESIIEMLELGQSKGCTALFDVGAGAGRILNIASTLEYTVRGGVEMNFMSSSIKEIYTMSFAELAADNDLIADWKKKRGKQRTLFYIYEGGIWDERVCEEAAGLLEVLAKRGDIVCLITNLPNTMSTSNFNNYDFWMQRITPKDYLPVFGDRDNLGIRDEMLAFFCDIPFPERTPIPAIGDFDEEWKQEKMIEFNNKLEPDDADMMFRNRMQGAAGAAGGKSSKRQKTRRLRLRF